MRRQAAFEFRWFFSVYEKTVRLRFFWFLVFSFLEYSLQIGCREKIEKNFVLKIVIRVLYFGGVMFKFEWS
jgi:hypothetical protein